MRALLGQLRDGGEEHAFVVRCACDPSPDGAGGETVVDHIRLFPLRDDVRWTYRVHEQILPALRRANVPVQWTEITVRHTGYVDLALCARKLDRDTKILSPPKATEPLQTTQAGRLRSAGTFDVSGNFYATTLPLLQIILSG